MEGTDTVVRSRRVVTPGGVRPADVRIAGSTIAEVAPYQSPVTGGSLHDVGGLALMPGGVDSHVHVNDPGTDWEGFPTASLAAAAGGMTTIVDMPLNSRPVTIDVDALAAKRAAARGGSTVDYGFWGGLVPHNVSELAALAEAGVLGFKAFLVDSGLPEFPAVSSVDLVRGMHVISEFGRPLLVHAELPGPIVEARAALPGTSRRYRDWLASRPPTAEVQAVEQVVAASRATGCAVHVVHVSCAKSLDVLRAARAEGLPVSAETCPHYLVFEADDVPDGATEFKCAPPIREAIDREALWNALAEGTLDLVASDHSPCPPHLKASASGDLFSAWGGISSLQVSLSATWTSAAARGFSLEALAAWMCSAPAKLAGVADRKGRIAAGFDADLVVFDPDREFTVRGEDLHHRHPITAFDGRRLRGPVMRTYLRGKVVYEPGGAIGAPSGLEVRPS